MISDLFRTNFLQTDHSTTANAVIPPPIDAVPEIIELHSSPVVGWGKRKDKEKEKEKETKTKPKAVYTEKSDEELIEAMR